MLPTLGHIGPITIRTYTLLLDVAVLLGLGTLAWQGWRTDGAPARWLDAGLSALVPSMIGGRLGHVAVHWAYFSQHRNQIPEIWRGGLDWHVALLLGLLGLGTYCWLRRVSFYAITDSLALVLPIAAMLLWTGCIMAGCAYGAEVRSLADYPAPIVAEWPDLFGIVAPRFTSQLYGALYSLLVAALMAGFAATVKRSGLRLWVSMLMLSIGAYSIGFTRGDLVPMVGRLRLDQLLDLAIAGLAVLGLLVSFLLGTKKPLYSRIEP